MLQTHDPWLAASTACAVASATVLSAASIHALQTTRLRRLLRSAAENSGWYRLQFRGRDMNTVRLTDLPVTHKEELMAHFADWVTDHTLTEEPLRRFLADHESIGSPYMERYVVWASSGSTGHPGIFVQDAACMAVYDALQMLRQPRLHSERRWLDPAYVTERVAFIGATEEHAASTVWLQRACRLNPVAAASIRCFSFLQPRARLLQAIQEFRPTVLSTYPGIAVELAQEASLGRLDIPVQEIWTGGETLTPSTRRFLEQAFHSGVVNSYGASEFFCLAFECQRGSLHLNSDWAILEPVDSDHRAVPLGQPGHTTLLTNLANHLQPLIRYDLGDRVTMHESPCGCGSSLPVITVEGRCDDILELGVDKPVCIDPLALTTVLEDSGLFDFQLVQTAASTLELREGFTAQPSQEATHRQSISALSAYLESQGASHVKIISSSEAAVASPRSGKIRRVIALQPHRA